MSRPRTGSTTWRSLATLLAAMLGAALVDPPVRAAPGDPDIEFGANGAVAADFGGAYDQPSALALHEGQIAAVGLGGPSNRFAIAVFDSAGVLDPSFSGDGQLIMDQTGGWGDATWLPDGDLLVATTWLGGSFGWVLARLNPDGSYHTSFGTGGKTTVAMGTQPTVRGMRIQSDGRIVLGGDSYFADGWRWAFARFLATGGLDASFGGGIVTTDFGVTSDDFCNAFALQSDDMIVAGGVSEDGAAHEVATLARYTTSGALDGTFGTGGKVIIPSGLFATHTSFYGLTLQPDGKVLACGSADGNSLIMRFTTAGVPDSTFGNAGRSVLALATSTDFLEDLIVDGSGRILAVGQMRVGSFWRQVLIRVEADGQMDGSFGVGGMVQPDYGTEWEDLYAVVLPSAGRVLVAGSMGETNVDSNFVLARYRTDAPGSQATASIVAAVDGEGSSSNGGATFTMASSGTSIAVERRTTTEKRGVIEFSLATIPDTAEIVGAELTVDIAGLSYFADRTYPYLIVYGYSGNGALSTADPTMISTQLGVSVPLTNQNVRTITLNNVDYIEALVQGGATHLGLVLYAGRTDHYAGFMSKEGAATFSLPPPTLTLRYNTEPLSPADFDGDGDVDLTDYQAWAACLQGPAASRPPGCAAQDFDLDGAVDVADFAVFQAEFGP